jgi:hypothetical protein
MERNGWLRRLRRRPWTDPGVSPKRRLTGERSVLFLQARQRETECECRCLTDCLLGKAGRPSQRDGQTSG